MLLKNKQHWNSILTDSILYELKLCWSFLGSDNTWAGLVSGLMVTMVAIWHQKTLELTSVILYLLLSFIYFLLYIYSFTIANQIIGVDEDRINKPDRPIVTNFVSIRGAKIRLFFISSLFILYGFLLGVGYCAVLWIGAHFWYHKFGHYHWMTKTSLMMLIGTFVLLVAGWQIVQPMQENSWKWAAYVTVFVVLTNHVQDFRDIKGDQEIGRKTLLIVFDQKIVRMFTSAIFLFSIPISIWFIRDYFIINIYTYLYLAIAFGLQLLIALRIMIFTDAPGDAKTYSLYVYLYCLYVIGGIFLKIK